MADIKKLGDIGEASAKALSGVLIAYSFANDDAHLPGYIREKMREEAGSLINLIHAVSSSLSEEFDRVD